MDGERIPSIHVKLTGVCPMCGVNPAPPVTYGQYDQHRYVRSDCAAESQLRADAIMTEIETMRAAREQKTDD